MAEGTRPARREPTPARRSGGIAAGREGRLRVLQVVHALPSDTYGGSELYTSELAGELADRGHEVAVASPLGDGSELPGDVELHALPATRPHPDREPPGDVADRARRWATGEDLDEALAYGPAHGLVRPRVERAFRRVLANVQPDVVHFQHLKGLSARLPRLCPADVACLVTLHDFWTICEREQLVQPDGTRCEGPASTRKCAACFASAIDDGGPERYRDATAWRRNQLARSLAAADRLVAPSSFLRERFERFAPDGADVVRERNGIRVDRFTDTGFDAGSPLRVGYAGRVTRAKGVHVLLEAHRRARRAGARVQLDVWGRFEPASDPYHARLRRDAHEDASFRGRYERTATPYEAVDVLVLPSLWPENSPLVIQEAFAANVPVVASDIGGMAELVDDGRDGLAFPVGDAEALAGVLERLARDPGRVEQLRDGIRPPHRLADHVDELEALYHRIVDRPAATVRVRG